MQGHKGHMDKHTYVHIYVHMFAHVFSEVFIRFIRSAAFETQTFAHAYMRPTYSPYCKFATPPTLGNIGRSNKY